jgi:TetR/AcrR family transcriptional regulator, cholesterol catabolism regulator
MQELHEKILRRTEEMFLKYGIKSLTMDDVARELGISKKTLYQFVENKNDLVSQTMDRHITEQCKTDDKLHFSAQNAIDEMLTVVKTMVNEMQKMKPNIIFELQKYHREVWEKIERFQHEYIERVAMRNLQWGRQDGLYRDDFDADIAVKFYIYGSFLIFNDELFPKPPYTFDGLFKEFIMNYLHGIASDKGREYLKGKV